MFRPKVPGQFPNLARFIGPIIEADLGISLTGEQFDLLRELYRIDAVSGRRIVRRAAIRRPKGWGKSPFGAMLAYAELVAPVVFKAWDDEGQPMAVRQREPWVQFAAVSEDQTDNVYQWLYEHLAARPDVCAKRSIDLGRTRIYLTDRPGRVEPVTSSAGSREGQRITFTVLDQSESWTRENGGRRLAGTLRRNVAKMGGYSLELQNAPETGDGSVADETARDAEKASTHGVLFDSIEVPEVEDLSNRPKLLAALALAYGEAAADRGGWVDLERLADEIQDPATDPSDARRYYLNQPASPHERAFDRKRFASLVCSDDERAKIHRPGELIVAGFDGSKFDDSTALVATHVETGISWLAGLWEKGDHDDETWEVDELEVTEAVAELFSSYTLWRLYCDPPRWETTIAMWAGKWGRDKVFDWWTNRHKNMGLACSSLATSIRAGEARHTGEADLVRHIGNAVRRNVPARDDEGRQLWSIAKDGGRKIDGAAAMVLSWQARRDALAMGARRRGKGGGSG